jgi:hypothetical protein
MADPIDDKGKRQSALKADDREGRRAKALKANLRRRKAAAPAPEKDD